jgi:hypothetical protein
MNITVHTSSGKKEAKVLEVIRSGRSLKGTMPTVKEVKCLVDGESIVREGMVVHTSSGSWEMYGMTNWMTEDVRWN